MLVCEDDFPAYPGRLGDVLMIKHLFHIWQHDWLVKAYINTTSDDAEEILDELRSIGADMDTMRVAYKNLRNGLPNTGLTYTSPLYRETVIVVSYATSAEEFFNSFIHELCHAKTHICDYLGIDLASEQAAYFIGGLSRDLFPNVKHLLCDCCRHKLEGNGER